MGGLRLVAVTVVGGSGGEGADYWWGQEKKVMLKGGASDPFQV